MRDPYEVLGVAKNASAKDIKSAYRKLAKKHHPDQNPNDPKAKDRFAAANQAYEIVGDEKNRARLRPRRDRRRRQAALPGFRGRGRRRSVRRLPPAQQGPRRPAFRVPHVGTGGDPFDGNSRHLQRDFRRRPFRSAPARAARRPRAGRRRPQRHARRHRSRRPRPPPRSRRCSRTAARCRSSCRPMSRTARPSG